jgi:hypothetical protein
MLPQLIYSNCRPPLTAEELKQHPEFQYVTWDLKPTTEGRVPVAKDRGGPVELSYEIHGYGPIHLVVRFYFISEIGLNYSIEPIIFSFISILLYILRYC